jgi:Flp pilus assembly protein TadD
MLRIAPRMMIVLLCGTMLAGCATTPRDVAKLTGGDTAGGTCARSQQRRDRQDRAHRSGRRRAPGAADALAGHYDDAIHVLSQLMLVASDDPRVVAEYGKTLAEKGRAQDAVEFLNRAIELSSNDWTLYSALGVSYDQLGNQVAARTAYEHALALRPEEPSVLNNYALSRMLAGDTDGARILIGRSQLAGGASDAKIASNIALLNKIDPARRKIWPWRKSLPPCLPGKQRPWSPAARRP